MIFPFDAPNDADKLPGYYEQFRLHKLTSWTWWNTPIVKIYCGNWVDYHAPRWYLHLFIPLSALLMLAMFIALFVMSITRHADNSPPTPQVKESL